MHELGAQGGAVRGISGGARANCEDFVGGRPVERELGLEASVLVVAPWQMGAAVLCTHTQLPTATLGTARTASERAELRCSTR